MELLPFQTEAAISIAERFKAYVIDDNRPFETKNRPVPFFQILSSLTGSGKTIVLADTIERIREILPLEPIVLWVSKGKVVVEQTFENLENGKYSDLIPGYRVKALSDCTREDIEEKRGLLLMATVATFNQRDKDRRIFRLALDRAEQSLWDSLKAREIEGARRPLIVVYDEGHNLSDQQTDMLTDLSPDAIISATATPRLPAKLARVVQRLEEAGWNNDRLHVDIKASDVVDSGLIKSHVLLGGYHTTMEAAVDDLLADMESASKAANELGADFSPKAIYVCSTNIVEGGISRSHKDDPKQPFSARRAPPILIWQYLVGEKGIDPATVAVYASLNMHKDYPPPEGFALFKGKENDYQQFIEGGYQHIIFNLSLQEGWDDPECYFAYIDKSMGSKIQIEQLIGRVLRQPNGKHYPNARLNTAHFYVRVDDRSVFPRILDEVRSGLADTASAVELSHYQVSERTRERALLEPKKVRDVPKVSILADRARPEVARVVEAVHDYRRDEDNVRGTGAKVQILSKVGYDGQEDWEWIEAEGGNRITARSLFVRKIHSLYPRVVNICDIEHPKFDARVEVGSRAAKAIEEAATRAVKTFLQHSILVQKASDTHRLGPVFVDPEKIETFKNSLHEGYSGLNTLEEPAAAAIDKTRRVWCRNQSRNGFSVPLLTTEASKSFYPDFLVWTGKAGKDVVAIDTKGDHLLVADLARKLLEIEQIDEGPKLSIRLISTGEWSDEPKKVNDVGFTVWVMRSGAPFPIHCETIEKAIEQCLQ